MFNRYAHVLISATLMLIAIAFGVAEQAAYLISAFFIGRELAQAEQRVISQYYGNQRANAPWWCGLEYRAWTVKGALDWVLPLIISILVSAIV